ncbi:MAG: hypothetical protein JNJ71_08165 [Rubrivivax sp.]|nr:hypothetical protein [Rubrivivax sp.]
MNPIVGWSLAVLAIAVGYLQWGWPGVVLGVTVVVFWMLLQFSRVVRVMRQASQAPVGQVPSAVMLHARLRAGMRLLEVLPLTRSLGRKLADTPETFAWADEAGDRVVIELAGGRVTRWTLERAAEAGAGAAAVNQPAPAASSAESHN